MHWSDEAATRQELRDCLWIAVAWTIPALFLSPFQNVPFIDDWTYAWSVQRLLERGELRILAWSTQLNFVQVLWGALFCLPSGFSFSALRVSTWAAALVGLWGFYLTLRELGVSRRNSLTGTAVLAVNPVFFVLSFSFMTDVPFLALMVWAAYAALRALRLREGRWLLVATFLTCLATGVRVLGIVIALATVSASAGSWGKRRARLLISLAPLVLFGAVAAWALTHAEQTVDISQVGTAPQSKLRAIGYALPIFPLMLLSDVNCVATTLGLWVLPLSAATLDRRRIVRWLWIDASLAVSLLVGFLFHAQFFAPLSGSATWSTTELGVARLFVPGHEPPVLSWWWTTGTIGIALASSSALLAALRPERLQRERWFLLWLAAYQFLALAVLGLFHDRYVLVLLPIGILLFLSSGPRVRPPAALALIGLLGTASIVGLADRLEFDRALWSGVEELRRRGAEDSEIDGGYVVNGWLHYAHPENAPLDERGRPVVPGLTTQAVAMRYTIALRPLPGRRVIGTIPFRHRLGRAGELYLLETVPRLR